jgi:hypothetical protein
MSRVCGLTSHDTAETLAFLAARPVQTVILHSFIRDNGIESQLNRGRFYGYRNPQGKLLGVALIGHTTLLETRSDEALRAFAHLARYSATPLHVVMAEGEIAETFWRHYAAGAEPRLRCAELLFELGFPCLVQQCAWEVRPARLEELEAVARAHADVAFLESGVDPLAKDREGFLKRCRRRIEQGRTFVVFANGELLFKADIAAQTDEVAYLEGVYVKPEARNQGVGAQCLGKLSRRLLQQVEHISLLSNETFAAAHRSFAKAGFRQTNRCVTLFA